MEKIIEKIRELEESGIKNVNLIALVSDTISEVIFYGVIDGIKYQSNRMVEEGKIEINVVDKLYDDIAAIIRKDDEYDHEKMNIVMADANKCDILYEDKSCKSFGIIQNWKKRVNA